MTKDKAVMVTLDYFLNLYEGRGNSRPRKAMAIPDALTLGERCADFTFEDEQTLKDIMKRIENLIVEH